MEREANKATTHTRNASFSSYLTRAEGNLVFKSPALNFSKRIDQDGEISVFGAERYFSMMLEDDSPRVLVDYNNTSRLVDYNNTSRAGVQQQKQTKTSRPGTPSTCSDASWNSKTTYLPSCRRNQSPKKKKNVNGKKIFSGFVCNGSCFDQKSIHVREVNVGVARVFRKQSFEIDHHHVKQSQPRFKAKEGQLLQQYPSFGGSNKEQHLVFANFGAKEEKKAKQEQGEPPRKSLQVFGSEIMKKGEDIVAINLERRLSMLSWDAIPKPQRHSITSGNDEMSNDDNESDASSDLFEIENLTGTGQPLIFTEQASDGLSMASPTKYESSETSIDCSVVTANVVSTAVSDYREKKLVPANQLQHQRLESSMELGKFTI